MRDLGEAMRMVKETKKVADEGWSNNLIRYFERNKNIIWKEVKSEKLIMFTRLKE